MRAGTRLLDAFRRRPAAFHAALATPLGWSAFARFCHGDLSFAALMRHRAARSAVAALSGR
jgi:hypothetical protein